MPFLQVGIDDTDSKDGMCTTYIGALIIEESKRIGAEIIDYPRLIRLNPNWPHKTRGNCAIAITIKTTDEKIPLVKKKIIELVKENAELEYETTNPGVVFYHRPKIPESLKKFSDNVIKDIVTIQDAEEIATEVKAEVHKIKSGNGIIGALAAIGENLDTDKTFELIAYRIPKNRGTQRDIDKNSVIEMDEITHPKTFDNYDPVTGEICITPHTPCPILYGIRAENPAIAIDAHKIVRSAEPIERWIVYKTNQATDSHYQKLKIRDLKPYVSAIIEGKVSSKPRIIQGGHIIFKIKDKSGELYCATFEPTKQFRRIITKLIEGDHIKVYGGVKEKSNLPLTLNLEKLEILKLSPLIEKHNPICNKCGKRAKSSGKNDGYICKSCKKKFSKDSFILKEKIRDLNIGFYEVPPRARRHLAKPLIRIFMKGSNMPKPFDEQLQPNSLN